MKRFLTACKPLMMIALATTLLFSACGEDDNKDDKQTDLRENVVGTYPVEVTVAMGTLETTLTITKPEKESELLASAIVNVPMVGSINISVVLSELKQSDNINGTAVTTGYYYKIEEQDISVMGQTMPCSGSGKYTDGYDGFIYKSSNKSYISLAITAADMDITIKSVE